ncbi:MAG TPA: autotransporter-associated beta strand repeat-containing protein, partial [Chthoniobacterales bacterium]|nr:autotransporter-associated beta strand repeat-containing protein [Chthoniobacterales bacterium]
MFQLAHGEDNRASILQAACRRRLAWLPGLCLILAAQGGQAATDYWNGSTDTDWFNAANWSVGALPSSADLAVVTSSPQNPVISGALHPGSKAVASLLYVGYSGTSSLTISAGGTLVTTSTRIGSGGVGSVLLTGNGSTWSNTGNSADFILGSSKSGTLTVANGASLKVGSAGTGTIYLGYLATGSGVLNIGSAAGTPAVAAGTIAAGVITTSAGTGTVNFNHTDPGYTFGTQITGPTAVQQNGGVTILSGANTYTGGTFIKAGTLQAASGSALGAGSVSVSGGILDLGGSGALTLTLGTGANFVANTGTLKLNILGSGSYDQIVGNGGKLTLGGTLDLSGSIFTGGTYQLFSGFSTSSAGTFSTIT